MFLVSCSGVRELVWVASSAVAEWITEVVGRMDAGVGLVVVDMIFISCALPVKSSSCQESSQLRVVPGKRTVAHPVHVVK